MNVGILADSHDNVPVLQTALEWLVSRGAERLIHAGDLVAPFTAARLVETGLPFECVFGNNDGERLILKQKLDGHIQDPPLELEWAGRRFLVLHAPMTLKALGASRHYDVIIYGHTHEVVVERVGKCLILNPGEIGGWLNGRRTCALLDTDTLNVQIADF